MHELKPVGEERKVTFLGGAALDGAPVAYVITLATVVLALSFFPMSAILGLGGSFPMSQGILGLVGWVLGPLAGAAASGIGALIGIFLAPHTAGPVPFIRVAGSLFASFAAGSMVLGAYRKNWWIAPLLLTVVAFVYFIYRALVINRIGIWPVVAGSFVNWSSLLLFALPTRTLLARWIRGPNWGTTLAALAVGTWMIFGLTHTLSAAVTYHMFNWPEEVWIALIPTIPFENILRAAIGVVIGGGVIAGLRSLGLVKPENAIY